MRGVNIVTIVQARMRSTRLPGKVLADLGGRTMLARVCRRAAGSALADELIVATSSIADDDPVADECRRVGVPCFRGSEDDVLDRFYRAAQQRRAQVVVRITADCPLIDAGLLDAVVIAMLRYGPDYASNVLRRTYPRGLDVEVVTAHALARAWRQAAEPYERAHVMPYIYRNPQSFTLLPVTGPEDLGHWRWTVDTADDLALVRAVYARLGDDDGFSWEEVRRLLTREPALAELNRHVRQKRLVEG